MERAIIMAMAGNIKSTIVIMGATAATKGGITIMGTAITITMVIHTVSGSAAAGGPDIGALPIQAITRIIRIILITPTIHIHLHPA
jgi:hypothetical protein